MAKRFTDTEKWKKPFIRNLKASYKLLWLYVCDDCDHSGIWQVDIEVAEIRIGEKLDGKKAIQFFGDKIILLDGGAKWFIPSFIEFQYPSGLNENNKAHIGIIKNLERYKDEIANFKPLESPLQGAMDMVMDMVMVKDKVKEMVILPFESENFIKYWTFWKDFKNKQFNFKFKTAQSEQSALNDLVNLSLLHKMQQTKLTNSIKNKNMFQTRSFFFIANYYCRSTFWFICNILISHS